MLASRHCILKTTLKESWGSFVWVWNNSNQRHKRHNFLRTLTLPSEGWRLESSSGRSSAHRNLLEGFQILRRAWTRCMWKTCPVKERDRLREKRDCDAGTQGPRRNKDLLEQTIQASFVPFPPEERSAMSQGNSLLPESPGKLLPCKPSMFTKQILQSLNCL